MFLLSLFVVWFVGAVLTQAGLRCADKFQDYSDKGENIMATVLWPATIVGSIAFYIFKFVGVLADKLVLKVCPNQAERNNSNGRYR